MTTSIDGHGSRTMSAQEVEKSTTAPPPPLPSSTHLITIPFPSPAAPTHLVAHLTLFRGHSILLWCGEAAEDGSMSPTARLTTEWAVAMASSSSSSSSSEMKRTATNSTSLYRTNADYAQPMAARLAKRFSLAQIFLSLSLPPSILASLEGPYAGPEGSRSLMLIEAGLKDVLQETLGARKPDGGTEAS